MRASHSPVQEHKHGKKDNTEESNTEESNQKGRYKKARQEGNQ